MDGTTYHTPQGGDAGRFRCGALPAVVCLLSGGRPGYLLREYSHGDQIRPLRRRRARDLYPLAASLRLRCRGPFRAGDSLRRADPDVAFSLPDGDYTLLTLGNAESPLAFEAGDRTLATLEMELAGLTPSGEYLDADELYWGVCRMHVDGSRQQTFTTYMNNIHCHLHVKVMWHNMPEDVGAYRMEIGQVPVGYSLCPDRCHTVGDKLIPAGNGKLATHVERTPLKAQELRGEFVTMRYTAEHIPVFRLWFGDKAVTEPIDLRRAFRTWGWNPDAAAVQEYRIQLTLFADGSVEVRPWIDADVEDWQDGGTFN